MPVGMPRPLSEDHDASINLQYDLNFIAKPRHVLIHAVVDHLVHHMMQPIKPGAPYIHGRAFPNRFQSFQHTDLVRIVLRVGIAKKQKAGQILDLMILRIPYGLHCANVEEDEGLYGQICYTFTGMTTALNAAFPCS